MQGEVTKTFSSSTSPLRASTPNDGAQGRRKHQECSWARSPRSRELILARAGAVPGMPYFWVPAMALRPKAARWLSSCRPSPPAPTLPTTTVALATTTGLWAVVTTDRERTLFVPANMVAGLVAGGTVWALADACESLDARIIDKLETVGVRRPRRWLAAISAAGVLASYAVDRAAGRSENEVWLEDLMRTRPVTPQTREMVRAILQVPGAPSARELLAQLDVAQESFFDDGEDLFATVVEFEVPDEVVRVVPHTQLYPVQARFDAPNGTELQVSLQIHEGKLAHLEIEAVGEDDIGSVDELLDRWPGPANLRYVRDDTDGTARPLT